MTGPDELPDRHISDLDLERYHLGMVKGREFVALEEHYLGCRECAARVEEAADYVDAVRAGIIIGNYDHWYQIGFGEISVTVPRSRQKSCKDSAAHTTISGRR
jgi:hypothetical protein